MDMEYLLSLRQQKGRFIFATPRWAFSDGHPVGGQPRSGGTSVFYVLQVRFVAAPC